MAVSVVSLRNGFSRLDTDGVTMFANGSSTLVKGSDGLHVVVDALTAWDGDIMQQALKKEGLHCDDIKFVVCTHSHSDHIGLLSLFSKADRHCVGYTLSHHQTFFSHPFDKGEEFKISDHIKIVPTPGHTHDDVSVIVNTSDKGIVAIAGDLFEREEDIRNPSLWRNIAGSLNPIYQKKYRKEVIQSADFIIPGHGPIFKVTQDIRKYFNYDE